MFGVIRINERFFILFRGYENIDFMFRHDQAREESKTHSELSWGRGQKIEYDFDLKKPNGWKDLQVYT